MSKKNKLCNSLFCQTEQNYPKALFRNTNTSYNTFNTNLLNDKFHITKYEGCFSSLRNYPNCIVIKELSSAASKRVASFISKLIYDCNFNDHTIIGRLSEQPNSLNNDCVYNIPTTRVKISMISNSKKAIIIKVEEINMLTNFNIYYKNINDYREIIN